MAQDKVSQRYAKAVFDYLKDEAKVRSMIVELQEFAMLIEGSSELTLVLTSDVYSDNERLAVVNDLVGKAKLSKDTQRVLSVLTAAKRLDHLKSIVDKLKLILLESGNVVSLSVETATSLETDEKKKIEDRFTKILGKKVEASYKVDPALLGGLRVTAAGRTYDGSLTGWLSSFEESLITG